MSGIVRLRDGRTSEAQLQRQFLSGILFQSRRVQLILIAVFGLVIIFALRALLVGGVFIGPTG